MGTNKIVVVGGGVIGLTTAFILSKDKANEVTVAAKHMPGDYDIDYCSPWAGANYWPVGDEGSPHARWERNTWPAFEQLARSQPEAGVHFQRSILLNREKDTAAATGKFSQQLTRAEPWYKDTLPNYHNLPKEDLPPGIDRASDFTSVCINTGVYLPWLVSQCLGNGAVFKRASFKHIADAAGVHHSGQKADVVVNCTGISSRKLGGVEDANLYPARGQVVVVRNDPGAMFSVSGTDDEDDEVCYIMQRAAGGGTVLGGCYQKHNWESQPDPNLAVRIMKRCIATCPALVGKDANGNTRGIEALDIIRHGVGLRPLREGGTRIEREKINGVQVVHNYGHGGFGYQSSYGSCAEAVVLVWESLNEGGGKARL